MTKQKCIVREGKKKSKKQKVGIRKKREILGEEGIAKK